MHFFMVRTVLAIFNKAEFEELEDCITNIKKYIIHEIKSK